MNDLPTVQELEHLFTSFTRDGRDDLLQELLVAHGGEAMAAIIDIWLLDAAGRELLSDIGQQE